MISSASPTVQPVAKLSSHEIDPPGHGRHRLFISFCDGVRGSENNDYFRLSVSRLSGSKRMNLKGKLFPGFSPLFLLFFPTQICHRWLSNVIINSIASFSLKEYNELYKKSDWKAQCIEKGKQEDIFVYVLIISDWCLIRVCVISSLEICICPFLNDLKVFNSLIQTYCNILEAKKFQKKFWQNCPHVDALWKETFSEQ